MQLGKANNLPWVQHVAMDGSMKPEVTDFSGKPVKSREDPQAMDVEIIKYLAKAGTLFAKEKYEHSYPHCWRCDTPLLNYVTSSWFVKVTEIKPKLLELAENIHWSPAHIKDGRFGKWLEGARDWSISRQRFGGSAGDPALLAGKTIAIARDAAYGFIYPANLETLHQLGAELRFFSPFAGDNLPACDAVWIPGGYPELHAEAIGANTALWSALHAHVDAGKPLLAECGGMMSLFEEVVDKAGISHRFGGLLPGRSVMQQRLAALGTQFVDLPEGRLAGHTFHYSKSDTSLAPLVLAKTSDGRDGEAIYRHGRLTASYVHFYFPGNPAPVAALLG